MATSLVTKLQSRELFVVSLRNFQKIGFILGLTLLGLTL